MKEEKTTIQTLKEHKRDLAVVALIEMTVIFGIVANYYLNN